MYETKICSLVLQISIERKKKNSKTRMWGCGPMPNVMAAKPYIGGTLCESSVILFLVPRHSLADGRYPSAVQ